jgi:hypothetical protein
MTEKIHSPRRYLFWGLVFLLVGMLWRLSLTGWVELTWEFVLPGLLIIWGLGLVISGLFRGRMASRSDSPSDSQPEAKP